MTVADRLSTLSVEAGAATCREQIMAKGPMMDGRMARFVVDDLRRRRLPVDKLLEEVGLQKADLANPEGRVPYAPAIRLIERAALLTPAMACASVLRATSTNVGCSASSSSIRRR